MMHLPRACAAKTREYHILPVIPQIRKNGRERGRRGEKMILKSDGQSTCVYGTCVCESVCVRGKKNYTKHTPHTC